MPTTATPHRSMYHGLKPDDVFLHAYRWVEVDRSEATRVHARVPVVVTITAPQTCGGKALWWRRDNPLYSGRAPIDPRSLRFYRFDRGAELPPLPVIRLPPAPVEDPNSHGPTDNYVQCELRSIEVRCAHPKDGKGKPRVVKASQVLQVAAEKDGDEITLAAGMRGGCGKHPVWTVIDPKGKREELNGREAKFKAKPKIYFGVPAWGMKPNQYQIEVTSCHAATQHVTVQAYPATNIELIVERKFAKNGKLFNRKIKEYERNVFSGHEEKDAWTKELEEARPAEKKREEEKADEKGQWEVRIEQGASGNQRDSDEGANPDKSTTLNGKLVQRILNTSSYIEEMTNTFMKQTFGTLADVQGELRLLPKCALRLACGYVETLEDPRTFVKWRLGADLVLLEGSLTVNWDPMATGIPPKIRKYLLDWAARFYLYATLKGEIAVKGNYGPISPDKIEGRIKGEGQLGVSVGGKLSLMSERVLTVDASANTTIMAEVEMPVRHAPEFECQVKWGGIFLVLVVTTFWSSSPKTHNVQLCEERKLWEHTFKPFEEAEKHPEIEPHAEA